MRTTQTIVILVALVSAALLCAGCIGAGDSVNAPSAEPQEQLITITDSFGRKVTVPASPDRVVCSGAGTLRYLTYLQAQDAIVGVDDIEIRDTVFDARPYALANPQFKTYPLIGEYRGNDDPEKIVTCNPQVIFKAFITEIDAADELQQKTGIPVVALDYGDLGVNRDSMEQALTIMGTVMGKEERAAEVIAYFDDMEADLQARTADIPEDQKKSVYIGGIAYRGPHGFQSTEPAYPPFHFVNAANLAGDLGTAHADVAKEKIIEWDPEVLFVDLSTLQTSPSAIDELKDDPSYQQLSAVKAGEAYGVLPYNWYTANHGSVMADAYYIGSVLYPDQFSDIDPADKADEIYSFLIDEPVYDEMNAQFGGIAFSKINLG